MPRVLPPPVPPRISSERSCVAAQRHPAGPGAAAHVVVDHGGDRFADAGRVPVEQAVLEAGVEHARFGGGLGGGFGHAGSGDDGGGGEARRAAGAAADPHRAAVTRQATSPGGATLRSAALASVALPLRLGGVCRRGLRRTARRRRGHRRGRREGIVRAATRLAASRGRRPAGWVLEAVRAMRLCSVGWPPSPTVKGRMDDVLVPSSALGKPFQPVTEESEVPSRAASRRSSEVPGMLPPLR